MMALTNSPFAGIFFDLDGTLADTAPDLVNAANLLLIARQLPPKPYAEMRPHSSAGARGLIQCAFGIDTKHPDFIPLRDEFFINYEQALLVHSSIFEGIHDLLNTLDAAKMPWGIVTNKSERFTHPLTELMGLRHRAASTVSGDTTAHPKPHPAPLLHAAEIARVDPNKSLYVGDDMRDIVAGKAAGMKTCAARYGFLGCAEPPEGWGADFLVNDPRELLAIVFPK